MTQSTLRARHKKMLKSLYLAAVVASTCAVAPVWAQDAEWDGPGNNWNDPANWDPTGPPDDTAFFNIEGNNAPNPTLTASDTLGEIVFQSGADNYIISTGGNNLRLTDQGIINESGVLQIINVNNSNGLLRFDNNATIVETDGNVRIENESGGRVGFFNDSSAGDGRIINANGGRTNFNGDSDAGNAVIRNNSGGITNFNDDSEAGDGLADGTVARIVNNGGVTNFYDTSTALDAEIINRNGGETIFRGTSTAGNATIENESTGIVRFLEDSQGFDALLGGAGVSIQNREGGIVDISQANNNIIVGEIYGGGNIFLGNNLLTLGDSDLDRTIGGVISDGGLALRPDGQANPNANDTGGSVQKEGSGILRLTGDNTYTGTTTVNEGTLQLDGSITSDTTVNTGATLSGNGTIGDFSGTANSLTNNDGTISPGRSGESGSFVPTTQDPASLGSQRLYGNLDVDGDFTIIDAGNALFRTRVTREEDGTQRSSAVTAGGSATLDGDVQALVDPNGTYRVNNRFLIVRADGGISGAFDQVNPDGDGPTDSSIPDFLALGSDPNSPTLGISYTPTEAFLILRRTTLVDQEDDFSENQQSVFESFNEAIEDGDPLTDEEEAIINNFILNGEDALDQASGDALTVFPVIAQNASNRFNQRMLTGALQQSNEQNTELAGRPSARLVYNGNRYHMLAQGTAAPAMTTTDADTAARRSSIWATIARAKDDGDSDGNGPGFDARATEYQVGFNRNLSARTVVGLSIGKSDAEVDVRERDAEGDVDTTSIGAFLRHDSDDWYASGLLSYSRHKIESERETGIGEAEADYRARTLALWGEVGKKMRRGGWNIEPNISLKLSNTDQNDFEEDGPGGLDVEGDSYNSRRLGLGVRVTSRDANARVRPHLFIGYEREFGDDNVELTNQLGGLSAFNVEGSELGKNIWTARLGANARLSDRFSLVGEIGASWRRNQDSQYIYGGIKYGW